MDLNLKYVKPRQPNLLLVDDDPEALQFLVEVIQSLDVRLVTASRGTQALKFIHDQPFDLGIVDLRLPDLSGIEVLNALRLSNPDSLRLLLTAYCDFEAATRAVNRVGLYHILIKPIEADYLTAILKSALSHIEAEWERSYLEARLLQLNRRLEDELKKRTEDARKNRKDLQRTKRELERTFWELVNSSRLSSLGLIMSVLAHDIRNPLTVLSGQLQILSLKPPPEEAVANRYVVMTRQVERIQSLVESVSRMAQSDLAIESTFPLRRALEEALNLTKKLFSTKGVDIHLEESGSPLEVRGNFGHWVHIFFKILEFIGRRTANNSIFLQLRHHQEVVEVRLQYSESQFPLALKRILSARRLPRRESADAEATAFYLCARILDQYLGTLRVSEKNGKATFIVALPSVLMTDRKNLQTVTWEESPEDALSLP